MRENHVVALGDVAADRHIAIDDRIAADVTLRAEQIEKRANPHLRGISGSLQEQHAKRPRRPGTGLIDFGAEHCRICCAWPASVRDGPASGGKYYAAARINATSDGRKI